MLPPHYHFHVAHPIHQWLVCGSGFGRQLRCHQCKYQYDDTSLMFKHYEKHLKSKDKEIEAWSEFEWIFDDHKWRCQKCVYETDSVKRIWRHSYKHIPRYLKFRDNEYRA